MKRRDFCLLCTMIYVKMWLKVHMHTYLFVHCIFVIFIPLCLIFGMGQKFGHSTKKMTWIF